VPPGIPDLPRLTMARHAKFCAMPYRSFRAIALTVAVPIVGTTGLAVIGILGLALLAVIVFTAIWSATETRRNDAKKVLRTLWRR
jgi:hypothetical protein